MARILILRPIEAAEETAALLRARGHETVILPVQETVALAEPPPAGEFSGFIVTSRNAVPALAEHFQRDRRPVLAVGERTAAAALEAGFRDVRAGAGEAGSLAEQAAAIARTGTPLLYAAGRVRTPGLEAAMAGNGTPFRSWEVYDALAIQPTEAAIEAVAAGGAPDLVLVLSAGQAVGLAALFERAHALFTPMPRLLCLSQRIFEALPMQLRASASISPQPSLSSLFDRHL